MRYIDHRQSPMKWARNECSRAPQRAGSHRLRRAQAWIAGHRVHVSAMSVQRIARREGGPPSHFSPNNYIAEANKPRHGHACLSNTIASHGQVLVSKFGDWKRDFRESPTERDTGVIFSYGPRRL
jgi:hypothetical protein